MPTRVHALGELGEVHQVAAAVSAPELRCDDFRFAMFAMEVWEEWWRNSDVRGWPKESSEVRAYHRAQTATVTDGLARYRGVVELGDGPNPKKVRRVPPAMPKETRATAGSRIPDIDHARLGPQVDRHLMDLADLNRDVHAALLLTYLRPKLTAQQRAEQLRISRRGYYKRLARGLEWLEGRLCPG